MRIPRIHIIETLVAGETVMLDKNASNHVCRVLRMHSGDRITLFNGNGGEYPAAIAAIDKKSVAVITATHRDQERESELQIHLGIAISRGERMDWIVQKTTELGVTALTPLLTERTEVKLRGERAEKKTRHWQKIAVSACEQCGRNRLPAIGPLQSLDSWVDRVQAQLKLVLHPAADPGAGPAVAPASIALLVGPEGGLSAAEMAAAEQTGFDALQLGPRVLRTETAPLAAIAVLQARWGDMSAH